MGVADKAEDDTNGPLALIQLQARIRGVLVRLELEASINALAATQLQARFRGAAARNLLRSSREFLSAGELPSVEVGTAKSPTKRTRQNSNALRGMLVQLDLAR